MGEIIIKQQLSEWNVLCLFLETGEESFINISSPSSPAPLWWYVRDGGNYCRVDTLTQCDASCKMTHDKLTVLVDLLFLEKPGPQSTRNNHFNNVSNWCCFATCVNFDVNIFCDCCNIQCETKGEELGQIWCSVFPNLIKLLVSLNLTGFLCW